MELLSDGHGFGLEGFSVEALDSFLKPGDVRVGIENIPHHLVQAQKSKLVALHPRAHWCPGRVRVEGGVGRRRRRSRVAIVTRWEASTP